jgi:hypothetical protein
VFIGGWIFRTEGLNRECTPMHANRKIRNPKFETRNKFKAPKGEMFKTPKLWLVERAVDLFRGEGSTANAREWTRIAAHSAFCVFCAFLRPTSRSVQPAPPGYTPASLPGLEAFPHRFRAPADEPQCESTRIIGHMTVPILSAAGSAAENCAP